MRNRAVGDNRPHPPGARNDPCAARGSWLIWLLLAPLRRFPGGPRGPATLSPSPTTQSLLKTPTFLGLLATTAALGMAFSFVLPFLSLWGTTRVGFTPVQFGAFMTAVTLSAMTLNVGLGHWSDRRSSRRTMLLLGGGGGMLGYAGYATVTQPWLLTLIGVTLVALGSICFSQVFAHVREVYSRVSDVGSGRPSAYAMSVVRVCFSMSWTVGPALAAAMLAYSSFTGLFLCVSGLFLLFIIGVWRFVPAVPPPAWTAAGAPLSIRKALMQADLLLCFLAMAAIFAAHGLNMLNLPLYLTHELGGTTRDLGITFGIGPVVELPLMLWFGQCATRTGRYRLMQLGMIATALYFACLLMATQPWHVFCAQALSGVSFAVLTNVAITFFQELRPGQAGLATSVFSASVNTGNLVGFLAFGFVLDLGSYRGIPMAGVLLSVTAFALFLRMHRHTVITD